MKSLLIGALTFLSINACADYSVECKTTQLVYQNTFSLEGLVYVDEQGISVADLAVETKKAGNDQVRSEYTLNGRGFTKVLAAGTVAKEEVTLSQFVKLNDEVVYLSIAVGMPGNYSSSLRLADGTTFKSKCVLK